MEKLNELILKGVEDGKRAFIGPRIVQIDLTGKCNNDCIGCWVHSPFIKNPPRDKNLTLLFEIILSDVGSSRETLEIIMALEDTHKNVHVIYNKQSTGTKGRAKVQGIYFS